MGNGRESGKETNTTFPRDLPGIEDNEVWKGLSRHIGDGTEYIEVYGYAQDFAQALSGTDNTSIARTLSNLNQAIERIRQSHKKNDVPPNIVLLSNAINRALENRS